MANEIKTFNFFKHKYGDELLVDVIDLAYMLKGVGKHTAFRCNFYGFIFITQGSDTVGVNDHSVRVSAGHFIVGKPTDVWHWQTDTPLQGYMLSFEENFLQSFFHDRLFLQKFEYLQSGRQSAFYNCNEALFERILDTLRRMSDEIHGTSTNFRTTTLNDIDTHILRAMLYEVLSLMKRATPIIATTECDNISTTASNNTLAERFISPFTTLVAEHFAEHRDIAFYADKLCITPNYLNKITKQTIGMSAKAYIHQQVVSEIKNLLAYTALPVAEIAQRLNFQSASYLVRYFRTQTGTTPLQYRQRET